MISTLGAIGLAGTGAFELVKFVKSEVKDAVSPIEKKVEDVEKKVEDVKMKVENIEASVNKVSYDKLLNNHSLI
jgi:archaellum component FlaC